MSQVNWLKTVSDGLNGYHCNIMGLVGCRALVWVFSEVSPILRAMDKI